MVRLIQESMASEAAARTSSGGSSGRPIGSVRYGGGRVVVNIGFLGLKR